MNVITKCILSDTELNDLYEYNCKADLEEEIEITDEFKDIEELYTKSKVLKR